MGELLGALRRLLGRTAEARRSRVGLGLDSYDRERARSMADEGGAAGARIEAQPAESRHKTLEPPAKRGG